jgi:hypothetical protein
MELYLYRVKVFGPREPGLFDQPFEPESALLRAVEERPTSRPRRGVKWHIGNVERIDETGIYFRLGRTTRSTVSQIDEKSGDFIESQVDSAPYTHVLLDYQLEMAAFVRRVSLAPTSDSIAKRLAQVLNDGFTARELRCSFSIGPVSNPDTFLETLKRGGSGFSDGGVSGVLSGQYSNRRADIHEKAKT